MEKFKIPVVRHLDEEDDVSTGKRDGKLREGQESEIDYLSSEIIAELKKTGKRGVFFISSSRIRSQETAEKLTKRLREIDHSLKISSTTDKGLDSLDEGVVTLPEGYSKDDFIEAFPVASKIFNSEVHSSTNSDTVDNLEYKYGDPVVLPSGMPQYPELVGLFKKYGESYKDLLLRVYSFVYNASKYKGVQSKQVMFVLIAHAQTSQMLEGLANLAKEVKYNSLNIRQGDLSTELWKEFLDRSSKKQAKNYTSAHLYPEDYKTVDASFLFDAKLMEFLRSEIINLS